MSTSEKRELDGIGPLVEQTESLLSTIELAMNKPEIASNNTELQELLKEHKAAQDQMEILYRRWEELERKLAQDA